MCLACLKNSDEKFANKGGDSLTHRRGSRAKTRVRNRAVREARVSFARLFKQQSHSTSVSAAEADNGVHRRLREGGVAPLPRFLCQPLIPATVEDVVGELVVQFLRL